MWRSNGVQIVDAEVVGAATGDTVSEAPLRILRHACWSSAQLKNAGTNRQPSNQLCAPAPGHAATELAESGQVMGRLRSGVPVVCDHM